MPHQAHHGLGRVELLGHERLGGRRSWGLPRCTSPGPRAGPRAAVLTVVAAAAVVVILVLTVRVGAVAASSIPAAAISVRGGRALTVPASPSAAVPTVAAAAALGAAATARRTHSPVTLVLVHQVGVVRIGAAAETRPATWKWRIKETAISDCLWVKVKESIYQLPL